MISVWLPTMLVALATAGILTAVGWLFAKALHVPSVEGLLISPAVGFGVFLVGGVLADAIGYDFTWWAGPLTLLAVVVLAGLSHGWRSPDDGTSVTASAADRSVGWARVRAPAIVATAAVVVHAVLIRGMSSPSAIPPGPDTVQGLGMAVHLAGESSADFLRAGDYMWTLDVTYPGGFQSLVATIFSWTNLSVIESAHAAILVLGAYVLPCGTVALARAVLGHRSLAAWAAALASVAFTVFPFFLLVAGPAWSNFASLALLPALLAVGAAAARQADRVRLVRLVVLAVVLTIAVAGCQPSSLFAAAVLLLPLAVTSRVCFVFVAGVIATAVTIVGWAFLAPSFMLDYGLSGADNARQGIMLAVKNDLAPLALRHLVLVPLLLLGLVSLARSRDTVWIVVGWVLLAVAWLAPALFSDEAAARLLWPWWNSGVRALAGLAIPSAIAVAAGAVAAGRSMAVVLDRMTGRPASAIAPPAVALALVFAAVSGVPASITIVSGGYQVYDEDNTWITPKEFDALGQIGKAVEPGAVVAENPYRGGAYLYITSGVRMLYPGRTEWLADGPDLLSRKLVDVQIDPAVCRAVEEYSVDYVLVGGAPAKDVTEDGDFSGVDAVAGAAGFDEVAAAGPYTLYRVPPCSSE